MDKRGNPAWFLTISFSHRSNNNLVLGAGVLCFGGSKAAFGEKLDFLSDCDTITAADFRPFSGPDSPNAEPRISPKRTYILLYRYHRNPAVADAKCAQTFSYG
jgi:hypothetical protein